MYIWGDDAYALPTYNILQQHVYLSYCPSITQYIETPPPPHTHLPTHPPTTHRFCTCPSKLLWVVWVPPYMGSGTTCRCTTTRTILLYWSVWVGGSVYEFLGCVCLLLLVLLHASVCMCLVMCLYADYCQDGVWSIYGVWSKWWCISLLSHYTLCHPLPSPYAGDTLRPPTPSPPLSFHRCMVYQHSQPACQGGGGAPHATSTGTAGGQGPPHTVVGGHRRL